MLVLMYCVVTFTGCQSPKVKLMTSASAELLISRRWKENGCDYDDIITNITSS